MLVYTQINNVAWRTCERYSFTILIYNSKISRDNQQIKIKARIVTFKCKCVK